MIRIGITGAAGRMGKSLIQALKTAQNLQLTVAVERLGSEFLHADSGEIAGVGCNGVIIGADLAVELENFDVLIDFSIPTATLAYAELCREAKRRLVIGTTGIDSVCREQLIKIAREIPIVLAPNMSVGVNLCFKILDLAARVLGENVDVEILEVHHKNKVDAPSGTALRMGEIIANVWGKELSDVAVYVRAGHTGPRPAGAIGFATIRAGEVAGEHSVWLVTAEERIEIVHKATSRSTFAQGALRAANWIVAYDSGWYDMQDVLGLR